MTTDEDFEELKADVFRFQSLRTDIRQKYPLQIREKIKTLISVGRDPADLSRELNISCDALQRWMNKKTKRKYTFKEVKITPMANKSKTLSMSMESGQVKVKFELGLEHVNILKELLRVI